MKLLFACADRATDRLLWSGTVWNCWRALEHTGIEIGLFDEVPFSCPLALRVLHQLHKRFGRRVHYLQIEPAILRRAARRIEAQVRLQKCDGVFCPGTGVPINTFVRPEVPVFTYLDATKRSWTRAYHGLATLCRRSRGQLDHIDRVGLANNRLSFFSSDWAADEARRDYGASAERTPVVPFGANLTQAPKPSEVEAGILGRPRDHFRCLFLGKEWERKGGPDALAVVRELRTRGLDATLDIVGCTPELAAEHQPFVRRHGFVDHSTLQGRKMFRDLLAQTHVLLFFSRAEAYGIALCEAAAFGVPALASRVGGIPTIIRHGANGWLTSAPVRPDLAANELENIFRSPGEYHRVAFAAREHFETRLNWRTAGDSLRSHIELALGGTKFSSP
jgi:glycosyltransferase involved in cell wall biosynthesis